MHTLTFIRDRILSPVGVRVPRGTPTSRRGGPGGRTIGSGRFRSSTPLSGPGPARFAGGEWLVARGGRAVGRKTARQPSAAGATTSALTCFATRRIDSHNTG